MRKIFSLVLILALAFTFNAYGADQWLKGQPAGSANLSDLDTLLQTNNEALDRLLSDYRSNCEITYTSASSITIAVGKVACSNSAGSIRKFRKNTSAVVATFSNLDTGSEADGTFYVYAVADTDATTFTVSISASASSPSGATYYKRLGSFVNSSSDILNDETITNDDNYYALQLGDWVSKTPGTTYQALTDGFVTFNQGTTGQCRGYTDSSNPPTTERAGSHLDASSSYSQDGFSFPVKKSDYYKTDSLVSSEMYFLPLE